MTLAALMTFLVLAPSASAPRENARALHALSKKDTTQALKHLSKALSLDTLDTRLRYNNASLLARAGKVDEAEGDFQRALKDTALAARAYHNRGSARLEAARRGQGDVAQAISDLRQALRLRPGWKEPGRNLELALRLRKKQEEEKKKQQQKKDQDPKKDQGQPPPPQPQPSPQDLQKEQAERLMDAAETRDASRRPKGPKSQESSHDKDW